MNITELKELAEKATPGPWEAISRGAYWDEEEGDVDAVSGPEIIGAEFVEPLSNQQTTRGHCWYRDAAYIAAANPAEILELIAKLEDAQGEIRALRATEAGLRDRVKELEKGLLRATDALDLLTDKVDGTGFAESDEFNNALDEIDLGRALLEKKE